MNRAWLMSPSRSLPICLAISSNASQRWSGMATLRTGCGGLKSPMARTAKGYHGQKWTPMSTVAFEV